PRERAARGFGRDGAVPPGLHGGGGAPELARDPERVAGAGTGAEDGALRPTDRDDVEQQRARRAGEIAAEQCGADVRGGRTDAIHDAGTVRGGVVSGARE